MTYFKSIKWIFILLLMIGGIIYFYGKLTTKPEKALYQTARLEKKTITQLINATGTLEAKGTLNIGSLVNGIVEALYVEENQVVKKGQLLAKIDDGNADTLVKQAKGTLEQAKSDFAYQQEYFKRKEILYKNGHISLDEFQKDQRTYNTSMSFLETQQAHYDQILLLFNNKQITSPIDGIIIKKNVSLREGVSNLYSPTVLYTIAEDIQSMQAELEIDETDIGLLKIGQEATITFDTYPHKTFSGVISEIGTSPLGTGSNVSYKAVVLMDNKQLLLKPGMTFNAFITVGKKKDVLSIPGNLFALNKKIIKLIAKKLNFSVQKMALEKESDFLNKVKNKENPIKSVWVVKNNSFIETPVELGITDNTFFEILSGITEDDEIVVDIEEPDAMEEMYKKMFGGGLSGSKS